MAIRDPELQGSLRGVHVLLIDDDAESLDQIKRVLEYCGALVTVRTFARQALGVLQAVRPTVLVLGIGTPDETAYAFIRSVRASTIRGTRQTGAGDRRNRSAVRLRPYVADQPIPVFARHREVDDDHVGLDPFERSERLARGGGRRHERAGVLEDGFQDFEGI